LKLKKRKPVEIMEWYEYQTKQEKDRNRDPDAKEKYYITTEEYDKIIKYSLDNIWMEQALWETLYLS